MIGELEDARKRATDHKQLSASIRAIEAKAKLAGLMVERQKVEVTDGGSYGHCENVEEVAAAMVEEFYLTVEYTHSCTEEDREYLAKVYVDAIETMQRTIDEATDRLTEEIRARPLGSVEYRPPQALPSPLNAKETEY